jgi:hypothetical protein
VLRWLRAQELPCPWDDRTCSYAAAGGHLHVLQWLRAQDLPCHWNEETCNAAAKNGYLHVLQWLRAQDPPCPWCEAACSCAAASGSLEATRRGPPPAADPAEGRKEAAPGAAWRIAEGPQPPAAVP